LLVEILRRTPVWVFVLFLILLALGYFQSRSRSTTRTRAVILPAAMILLSFYGVISAFGISITGILAWLAGAMLTVWLNQRFAPPATTRYSPTTQALSIPGSWLPLALMMAIFFIRYAVAVTLARQPTLAGAEGFVSAVCLVYGGVSGLFLARALRLWHAAGAADIE